VVIAHRRTYPADDLISALIRAERGVGPLSEEWVPVFAVPLRVAGNEITENRLGDSLVALTANFDEQSKRSGRANLIADVVEDLLRYSSPGEAFFFDTPPQLQSWGASSFERPVW